VFIPSATSRGLSQHLWKIEQTSHAIAHGYFVGTINRVGIEAEFGTNHYYGQSYFCDPTGQFVGEIASEHTDELVIRDLNLDLIKDVRDTWQFYRDRRPDMYADVVAA
jgi:N-carbamoylputrescine amidase